MLLTDFINNGQTPGTAGVWRTDDGGATWSLKQQADWAHDVFFDPTNPKRAYMGGSRDISNWGTATPGNWGYGGFMFSDDAGALCCAVLGGRQSCLERGFSSPCHFITQLEHWLTQQSKCLILVLPRTAFHCTPCSCGCLLYCRRHMEAQR